MDCGSAEAGVRFQLFVRCTNCLRDTSPVLDVPVADDAPTDVDELLESAALQQFRFECQDCGSAIASLVGANLLRERAAA
jgi:hypothetical protein